MREFKFRAWISKKNENTVFDSGMYGWEDVKTWAYLWEMVEEGTVILMEYTNEKDKNNKEICEGDKLKVTVKLYNPAGCQPNPPEYRSWEMIVYHPFVKQEGYIYEIIGHAYEDIK